MYKTQTKRIQTHVHCIFIRITINKLQVCVERIRTGTKLKHFFESYKNIQIIMIKNNNGQIYYIIHAYNSIQRGGLSFDCRDIYRYTAQISSQVLAFTSFLIVIFT